MKYQNKIISTAIVLGLGFLALFSISYAVSPPPDGGYAGANTAEGQNALLGLTTGTYNTAVGFLSLLSNTKGNFNTAVGAGALLANVGDPGSNEGIENTATGAGALLSNTTGGYNTANGAFALSGNTTGGGNTAVGDNALNRNTGGGHNIAIGQYALFSNTTAINNTATGVDALFNSTGNENTAMGTGTLAANTTGNANTALGYLAGSNLTTGDNNIDIGNNVTGIAGETNTIRIGNTDITTTIIRGISGQTIPSGATVIVASNGQLGTTTSSERFKDEIKPMDSASEAILALKPVTFHYKSDKTGTPQFGLIAEEVAEVNPNLVVRDENGEIYTVRYDAVNAMLLNEFLKEHKKVEEQQSKIESQTTAIVELRSIVAQQQKATEILTAQLKEQAEPIQRVSAQMEVSRARSGVVRNDR